MPFQRSTYLQANQQELSALFDGIDTNFYCPRPVGNDSQLKRTWPADVKIVTYVSRGSEAIRGFDIFMEVAHRVSQLRDDVHFVIAGNPKTNYGSEMITIKEPTFKEHVLKQHPYDLNRFHFLDWISEPALRDLFRLSDSHFCWTVPFASSWSLFQSLSVGCVVMASDSPPVRDLVTHNLTGFLVEPYAKEAMAAMMLELLDKGRKDSLVRENGRQSILKSFSYHTCLPALAEFYFQQRARALHDCQRTLEVA